jgi:hypothetical protein
MSIEPRRRTERKMLSALSRSLSRRALRNSFHFVRGEGKQGPEIFTLAVKEYDPQEISDALLLQCPDLALHADRWQEVNAIIEALPPDLPYTGCRTLDFTDAGATLLRIARKDSSEYRYTGLLPLESYRRNRKRVEDETVNYTLISISAACLVGSGYLLGREIGKIPKYNN